MPDINYAAWKFWIDLLVLVVVTIHILYTWWSNKEKVTKKLFQQQEAEIAKRPTADDVKQLIKDRMPTCSNHLDRTAANERGLSGLQLEVARLPNKDELIRAHNRLDEALNKVENLAGKMSSTDRKLDLVLEELLRREK
ncbi:MAG: hypothetical protein C0622_05255 [Desulfuromonas sp.]|nr:MAG: hypothetical protein C0622_05255 [Desulfuromonas sp.]